MPNRIVRDAILTSESVCSLGWPAEVFYRRLMSIVDDYGRCEALPQLLRSRCYPLQTDLVRVADITRWMAECQKSGVILYYEVAGKQYLQIEKFGQQQRSASKYPAPLAPASNCAQALSNAHLGVSVFVSEDVGVSRGKRAKPAPKVQLPEDFGISAAVAKWAAEKGYDRLAEHLDAFARKCRAKGYAYADWDAAFQEAVREDWAKLRGSSPRGAAPPPESVKSADAERSQAYLREQAEHAATSVPPPPNLRALVRKMTSTAA